MLWTLTYRSPERTLTDVEVDGAHAAVASVELVVNWLRGMLP